MPVTVALANFMTGLDQSVIVTALPAISLSLHATPSALGLAVTAYLAALVIALPLGGWASERFGMRNAYCLAVLAFTLASVLCGLAQTQPQLVAARLLQGMGGALMGTIGQVAILRSFARHRTLKINTFTSLASQMAPMVGPIIGGLLTTYVSWRWIFFVNLPAGVLVLIMATRLFPRPAQTLSRPFDAIGFLPGGTGTALLVFGMSGLADSGLAGWLAATRLLVAGLLLGLAVRHCRRVSHPIVDLTILRFRTFRISLSLHRARNLLVKQHTQLVNMIRALLAEFGIDIAEGLERALGLARRIAAKETVPDVPAVALQILALLCGQVLDTHARLQAIDRSLLALQRSDDVARRLSTIPGIGPVGATALAASVADPTQFRSGREFAAWLGLTPSQKSSGGKDRLGRITKMGDRYLRKLLVVGATSLIRRARHKPDTADPRFIALLARKPVRVASVAMANKMARIVWAIMVRGEIYQTRHAPMLAG
nr:IS110 family transposase [Aureimonas leprariae]